MKKNIILAAFMFLSLNMVNAQNNAQVRTSVAARFTSHFPEAKNVQWTELAKGISQVQFVQHGASWLAYFNPAGDIIASGRRIKRVEELPLKVQSGYQSARASMEKGGHNMELVSLYEMISDAETIYYATMRNERKISTYSIGLDGSLSLKLNKPRVLQSSAPADVIAKKN